MDSVREQRWQRFLTHLQTAPGHLSPDDRAAAFANEGLPDGLAGFVDTVVRHAYRVTDEQVESLRQAGYSEDEIFEASVLAAVGEADRRLQAALAAMAAPS